MVASYDPALTDEISRVRQKVGDTDVGKAQVQDESIEYYLSTGLTVIGTARQLALDLAAKWAKFGDVTVDDQMQRSSQIYKHYMDLAARLALEDQPIVTTAEAAATPGIMVGGLDDCRGPITFCDPCDEYPYSSRYRH